MMFNSNVEVPKAKDSKEYQKLQQDYDSLEKSFIKLFERVKHFETILDVCYNLTQPQLDTLETLMSQDSFINSLHDIRVYSIRIPKMYPELREKYLCKPYYFGDQNNVDTLLQQTIYSLRVKFIKEQRNKSKDKWSDNRKQHIEENKEKYSKVDGRSSANDKYMKEYINNLCEETYKYTDEYLKEKFGNIYFDLVRLQDNGTWNANKLEQSAMDVKLHLDECWYNESELQQGYEIALNNDDKHGFLEEFKLVATVCEDSKIKQDCLEDLSCDNDAFIDDAPNGEEVF